MRYVLTVVNVLVLMLTVPCVAQQNQPSSEAAAVQATVQDYVNAYRTGDSARMEKSLHPQYLKHVMSGPQGTTKMFQKTGLQMVEDARTAKDFNSAGQRDKITVFDVAGDIASAKLVTRDWTDYLCLAKWNGEWKIVSVLLRTNH